jgi:hypothetical protein
VCESDTRLPPAPALTPPSSLQALCSPSCALATATAASALAATRAVTHRERTALSLQRQLGTTARCRGGWRAGQRQPGGPGDSVYRLDMECQWRGADYVTLARMPSTFFALGSMRKSSAVLSGELLRLILKNVVREEKSLRKKD